MSGVYPAGDVTKRAEVSKDGRYRYLLTRTWDPAIHPLRFVMLNPSIADATVDDPTIRRCAGFAARFGFGGVSVLNLYAFRATKPSDLWKTADPIGPENDCWLRDLFHIAAETAEPVVAAWGGNAKPSRVAWVSSMPGAAESLHHLGLTGAGAPRHPLYLPRDAPLARLRVTS